MKKQAYINKALNAFQSSFWMKLSLGVFLTLALGSCKGGDEKGDMAKTPEAIHQQIQKNKDKITLLRAANNKLNQRLQMLGGKNVFKEPVTIQSMQYQEFNHHFTVSGSLEAVKEANISPETNGRVIAINVKEGQVVAKGDLLIVLDHSIISNNIQEVESNLRLAQTVFERQERLWNKQIGSEIQFLEAKNNKDNLEKKLTTLKSQLDMAKVKSPINGIVEKIYMKTGEFASPGAPLIEVVNLNRFYLKADVSEAYLPIIKKGLNVAVSFPSFPGIHLNEKIKRVGNVVSTANRSFEIELEFINPNQMLKPNIVGDISINDYENKEALVVPTRIIRNDVKGAFIYIAKQLKTEMVAEKVYVQTGPSDGKMTLIEKGIQLGDPVIISGYASVSDGSPIAISSNQ